MALIERWQSTLAEVIEALGSDQQLQAFLMDGNQPFEAREEALYKVLPDNAPMELANLLKLLVERQELDLLIDIPSALAQVGSAQRKPVRADVVSAAELSESERTSMRETLTKQYGPDLIFSFNVDPSLMGGLRVRVGDRLIDTSVASRLAALRESVASIVR